MTDKTDCVDCPPPADTLQLDGSHARDSSPAIFIEFCLRCHWHHRATWLYSELLQTFVLSRTHPKDQAALDAALSSPDTASQLPSLASITLLPRWKPDSAGRFRVWLVVKQEEGGSCDSTSSPPTASPPGTYLLWDRKTEGRFPESKEIKQIVRDHLSPNRHLGHSDKKQPDGLATPTVP